MAGGRSSYARPVSDREHDEDEIRAYVEHQAGEDVVHGGLQPPHAVLPALA
jgi:hypothetical protein